ncbi:MAG: hypothetical protein ACM3OF_08100 [Gemmatimonas sp.]
MSIITLFLFMSIVLPGRQPFGQIFMYSVLMAIQLGMAVIAATTVAQRFIRGEEDDAWRFPPLAELALAALVVVGLCIVLRIGWPLVQDLLNTGSISFSHSLALFVERWSFVLLPFQCTYSIGLTCAYHGRLARAWWRLTLVGAALNAAVFAVAGFLISALLRPDVLQSIGASRSILTCTLAVAGFVLGAIVLGIFPRSVRVTRRASMFDPSNPLLVRFDSGSALANGAADVASLPVERTGPRGALQELGGYSRESVANLEGRYVCFRPTFTNPSVINAYEVAIRWDDQRACLLFEERNRPDSNHAQIGQVYIPDGKPFMSLVTIDRGAVRVMMVSRPDHIGAARGLVLTLSNPARIHFIPATAPVVLQRLGETPARLGFVHQDSPDYAGYLEQLAGVTPEFATFAPIAVPLKVVTPSAA